MAPLRRRLDLSRHLRVARSLFKSLLLVLCGFNLAIYTLELVGWTTQPPRDHLGPRLAFAAFFALGIAARNAELAADRTP